MPSPSLAMSPGKPLAAVIYDFPVHRHAFTQGMEAQSGGRVLESGAPYPVRKHRITTLCWKLPLMASHALWFAMRNRNVPRLVTWQQDHGLIIAIVLGALRLRPRFKLSVATFIATPKRRTGFAGRCINFALTRDFVDRIVCFNQKEVELYKQTFPKAAEKFEYTLLGEEIEAHRLPPVAQGKYYLAAGRSNRDYDFLVSVFRACPQRQLVILSDLYRPLELPTNVQVRADVFGDQYLAMLAGCKAVLLAFTDPTVSAGQLVLIQAMQLGKPVISERAGCVDGYLFDDVTGLACEKDVKSFVEALQRLDDPAIYETLSTRQRIDHRQRFSIHAMGQRLWQLISQPCNPSSA